MGVSQFARGISESPTMALNEQARVLREQGESIVHLGIGEPQNRAPQAAIDTAAEALGAGRIKYTPASGMPSFKKAVIQYTEQNYGRTVSADATSSSRRAPSRRSSTRCSPSSTPATR